MNKKNLRISYFLPSMIAALLGYGSPAFADNYPMDFDLGIACRDFALRIDLISNGNYAERVSKVIKVNGFVRTISAGTGSSLRYTNLTTSKTISTKSNGAVSKTITDPTNKNSIVQNTGHTVLILYPTDTPAGPSTTLYDGGLVVYLSDAASNFTVLKESGRKIDICAALS